MPTISQLTATSSVTDTDQVPVYLTDNGDARKASMSVLKSYITTAPNFTDATLTNSALINSDIGTPTAGNLINCFGLPYIGTGTGAVSRPVVSKLNDIVSVKDFGAVGDGTTDDTTAVQAALSSGAVAIFFPAGRYIVTSNLTRSGHTYLYGDTMTTSILQMNGTSSFVYTGGAAGDEYNTSQLQIERLSFECPTATAKSVIAATWTDGIGGTSKTFIMRDCEITGTVEAGGFTNAVALTNARNIVVESVRILGDRSGPTLTSGSGFVINGTNPTGAPVEMYFNKVQVYFVDIAFAFAGWVEGVYFTSCTVVACHTGISAVAGAAGPKPLISVLGCHINTDKFCITTVGFTQCVYADNLIYAQHVDNTSTGYTAIALNSGAATLSVQIDNNNFQGLLTGITKNGVVVQSGGVSDLCLISNNIFLTFDTAIWLQTNTANAVVTDTNLFTSCTTNILNQGTSSNINCNLTVASGVGNKQFPDGLVQRFGSSVVTLDASGNGTIALSPAFANAFLSATISSGDPAATGGDGTFSIRQTTCTTSSLAFSVRPNPGAVSVRANWSAYGN